jgi:type II secretory pathway predicted ATPase ExeA
MYERHFGLSRRPFAATAEAVTYYPATPHERALEQLLDAWGAQVGFAALVGEAGTGKTLVGHRLLSRLEPAPVLVWLNHTHLPDHAALFQALLHDLDLPYLGQSEEELRLQLIDHLLQVYQDGKQTLILVDEAQHLPPALLEELRLLGNLEARQSKVVQMLLIGKPVLMETIRQPELASLAQRIGAPVPLPPLDVHEAVDYLRHHLKAAGGRPERLVSDEALTLLAERVRGVPRLLNQALHLALQFAWTAGQAAVDSEAVLDALHDLGVPDPDEEAEEGTIGHAALSPLPEAVSSLAAGASRGEIPSLELSNLKPVA